MAWMERKLEGAEATLTPVLFAGLPALCKERLAKSYRPASLDERIRSTRTRVEAKLLARAKAAGVPCPYVLGVAKHRLTISKMEGETLNKMEGAKLPPTIWKTAGAYLARLHGAQIVHGDYTPANLMLDGKVLSVIDFGLGSVSHDVEDYAVDIVTMKKSLGERAVKFFLEGYSREGGKLSTRVLKLVKEVESRARYQDRGAG
jgi:Kae1-associated kinase Bud32